MYTCAYKVQKTHFLFSTKYHNMVFFLHSPFSVFKIFIFAMSRKAGVIGVFISWPNLLMNPLLYKSALRIMTILIFCMLIYSFRERWLWTTTHFWPRLSFGYFNTLLKSVEVVCVIFNLYMVSHISSPWDFCSADKNPNTIFLEALNNMSGIKLWQNIKMSFELECIPNGTCSLLGRHLNFYFLF